MRDTIYREDAIKAVWGDDINPSEDGMVYEAQSHIDRDIRLIPSADRPHGEWIEHERAEEVNGMLISNYECPCCHEWELKASNYCPDCGCRNRKE